MAGPKFLQALWVNYVYSMCLYFVCNSCEIVYVWCECNPMSLLSYTQLEVLPTLHLELKSNEPCAWIDWAVLHNWISELWLSRQIALPMKSMHSKISYVCCGNVEYGEINIWNKIHYELGLMNACFDYVVFLYNTIWNNRCKLYLSVKEYILKNI